MPTRVLSTYFVLEFVYLAVHYYSHQYTSAVILTCSCTGDVQALYTSLTLSESIENISKCRLSSKLRAWGDV